jgi:phage tail-like protein
VGATLDTVLLEKGVTTLPLVDTAMWMWAVGALQGEISRATLLVQLLARAQEPDRIRGTHRPIVAKEWVFHECIPVRMKLASDLDATDEDVSIAELEISANWVEQTPLETLASAG